MRYGLAFMRLFRLAVVSYLYHEMIYHLVTFQRCLLEDQIS